MCDRADRAFVNDVRHNAQWHTGVSLNKQEYTRPRWPARSVAVRYNGTDS